MSKAVFFIIGLILSVTAVYAQFHLPQFDIELKGGYGKIDAGEVEAVDDASYSMATGALHIQINERIAIGGFYSKGLSGNVGYKTGQSNTDYPLRNLMYGLSVRFSSSRAPKWRPYLSLLYGKSEFVQEAGTLNLASQNDFFGLDGGIMLRFGRNFYWKVIEVSPRVILDQIWWLKSDLCIEAKTGILYNIRLKTK